MHLGNLCFIVLHNYGAPFLERLVILLSKQRNAFVQLLGKTFMHYLLGGSSVFILFRKLLDGTEADQTSCPFIPALICLFLIFLSCLSPPEGTLILGLSSCAMG